MDLKNKSDMLKTKEVYGNSGRDMYRRSRSTMVSSYNDNYTTTLESPVIYPPSSIISDSESVKSGRNSGKRHTPYMIYEQHVNSPRIITNLEGNSILPKLGERANNVPLSNYVLSPAISVKRVLSEDFVSPIHIPSPCDSYESECYSSGSRSEQFDYKKFYNPKRRNYYEEDEPPKNIENETIKLLKEQVEKQSQMLELLLERDKAREVQQESGQRSTASANYTIPKSEPDDKPKTPDYESMNEAEVQKYESRFRSLFDQLKNSYARWNIEVPKIGQIPLRTVHEIYEEIVKTITVYQTAMKYKVALVIAFAGIEYVAYSRNKIKAFKNFTRVQIKAIHKYDCYLLSFAKSLSDGAGEWSPLAKFIMSLGTSTCSFAAIQAIANSFGKNAPTDILFEADKFVSPTEGPAKLNSDGISEVPVPPEGLQDPNVIIKKGAGLLDFIDGVENPTEAEPVNVKEMPKSNYDEVYD